MRLLTDEGRAALDLAADQPDPGSVAAAGALRKRFDADLAAAALTQEALRRRALPRFGDRARAMLFTRDGLEQATRPEVSRWRARRLVDAGVTRIVDLGCGIAADAMGMAEAGIRVTAVELDPDTAAIAAHNLSLVSDEARVEVGNALDLAPGLLADPGTAVFLDPARRTARGRTWRTEDLTPPWPFALDLVESGRPVVVKLGPGIDRDLLPDVATSHVSQAGDAVETTLWAGWDAPRHEAVLIDDGGEVRTLAGEPEQPPVGPLAGYVHEPDPAVSRAALVGLLGDVVQLDQHAGYFSSDEPLPEPFATSFEVLEVLDARPKELARWVRVHDIGTLEIKKRGRGGLLDTAPAVLRRQLKPSGRGRATLLLARVSGETHAIHARRVCS